MAPMPPPPPKPSPPAGTPADEADRLGREHSNKREMKMRQERARVLADEPAARRGGGTGVPGVPGAPVVQPRPREPEAPRPPRPEPREPRVERPEREVRPDRPERDRPKVVERLIEPVPAPPTSVIDEVAVEAEELLREQAAVWRRFAIADKISFIFALITGFGTLLPWLWRKNEQVVIGLASGGVIHAAIAVAAMALLLRRERPQIDERGLRPTPQQHRRTSRRTALWMLLLSLMSTVAGTFLLLEYGLIRRQEVPTLEVALGFYVTLAAGLGLSYSGFAYFWRGGRE
jgi:hypothetical protein